MVNGLISLIDSWSRGVMVSTLDFESNDPGSNPGETFYRFFFIGPYYNHMVPVELHNLLTPILAVIITAIVMIKNIGIGLNWWEIGNLFILMFVIISTSMFEYKMKLLVLILSITWFGSTIIQQLVKTSKKRSDCDWTDIFSGNLMLKSGGKLDDAAVSRIVFVILYLFAILMLMIILLYKIDSQTQILNFLDDKYRYIFIILLPLIIVFINESPNILSLYGNDDNSSNYMTSDLLFKRFITGNYDYGKGNSSDNNKYVGRFIITSMFVGIMFILFINYTTSGDISIFSNTFGVGNSNMPIYILLFILTFFNFVMETLFMQKCSYKVKTEGDNSRKNDKNFSCRISKYGGIVTLLFISYTVSVLYQINGTRDKMYSLLFIVALTFGFSQLFITLENKK
tara:strand:+ start:147 stop:1340 length:1194 start_codon:yes stop_codon:yes gene_type:complete